MGIYPGAIWEPVSVWPGHGSNGPMSAYTGIVLHCNDAESGDLHDYITASLTGDNPVSCHFQVLADGTVYQYIDTSVSSWCQGNGNDTYLSIESQGLATEPATERQVAAVGGILAWTQATHGIPLRLANAPGDPGLGWHGMGAAVGWGHAVCPGVRRDQRADMLIAASGLAPSGGGTPIEGDDMTPAQEALLTECVQAARLINGLEAGTLQCAPATFTTAHKLAQSGHDYAQQAYTAVNIVSRQVLAIGKALCPAAVKEWIS